MKNTFTALLLLLLSTGIQAQAVATIFDEGTVARIDVIVRPDSFQYIYNNQINTEYVRGHFYFTYNGQMDSVKNVGFRLRGNTSLAAQKKSFKISFNEYDDDGEFQGLRKLNLRGSHNDPSMMREKLFYHAWNNAGLPERRSAFVEVFINYEYFGLYTNIEEIDKRWLERVYGNNGGNLYKCQWPANLAYLGTDPNNYKNVYAGNSTRAYDLKTNELADDYTRFALLATRLNEPVDAEFPAKISAVLNVESVLHAFAFDVATGNWDDYFYNQNNYYLYDNPATGKFEFFTLDTDNTFGVDWVNRDWAKRDCLDWYSHSGPRPLATQLLAVPEYKQMFINYLYKITNEFVSPNALYPYIDEMHDLITPFADADIYRTYDYGYTMEDFHKSITHTIDGHTPYGIKPFLETRRNYTLQQLQGLVPVQDASLTAPLLSIWPNPAVNYLYLDNAAHRIEHIAVYDMLGQLRCSIEANPLSETHQIAIENLPQGMYRVVTELGTAAFLRQ